jgi:hypothetical protein
MNLNLSGQLKKDKIGIMPAEKTQIRLVWCQRIPLKLDPMFFHFRYVFVVHMFAYALCASVSSDP